MRGDCVRELARLFDLVDRDQHLRRNLLIELDVLLELRNHGSGQRLGLLLRSGSLADCVGEGLEELLIVREPLDPGAVPTLDQHLDGTVGQLQQLKHGADGAHGKDVGCRGIVLGRIFLRDEEDLFVVLHHVLERQYRLLAPDKQRHDHVGEHHDVAKRQNRIERTARKF